MQHQAYTTTRSFLSFEQNENIREVFAVNEIVQIKIPSNFAARERVTLCSLKKGGAKQNISKQEFLSLQREGALVLKPPSKKRLKRYPVWF
jgi:hypothetical protein